MGVASNVTDVITSRPLTSEEEHQRTERERVRQRLTTTPGGDIVEEQAPEIAGRTVQPSEPAIWD
jgi:hypothetical protein